MKECFKFELENVSTYNLYHQNNYNIANMYLLLKKLFGHQKKFREMIYITIGLIEIITLLT